MLFVACLVPILWPCLCFHESFSSFFPSLSRAFPLVPPLPVSLSSLAVCMSLSRSIPLSSVVSLRGCAHETRLFMISLYLFSSCFIVCNCTLHTVVPPSTSSLHPFFLFSFLSPPSIIPSTRFLIFISLGCFLPWCVCVFVT